MELKRKLKKINRGLVLAGIIVVVLVIYIIVDTVSFKKQKPDVEAAVKEYATAFVEKVSISESDYDENGVIKEDVREAKLGELRKVIDEYWTENSVDNHPYYTYRKDIMEAAKTVYSDKENNSNNIKEMLFNIKNVKIGKYGSNAAYVSAEVEINTDQIGSTDVLQPFGSLEYVSILGNVEEGNWDLDEKQLADKYQGKEIKSNTSFYSLAFVLFKEDGKWKISSVVDNGYSSSANLVNEETQKEVQ